jgi:hypothetical protein
MSLATRLAKLEAKHSQVLRCIWCRYSLSDGFLESETPHPKASNSVLQTKCWYCGTRFDVPLEGLNDHQREAVSLIYNSHPSKQFVDERVHAAHIWLGLSDSEVKKYEEGGSKTTRTLGTHLHRPLTLKGEKVRRKQEELKQRAFQFRQRQTERFKRLANGPESFPLDETLKGIKFADPTSRYYYDQIDELIRNHGFDKDSDVTRGAGAALDTCNLHLIISSSVRPASLCYGMRLCHRH